MGDADILMPGSEASVATCNSMDLGRDREEKHLPAQLY
jgi:hypothetical protein